jgi:hypothetical protein
LTRRFLIPAVLLLASAALAVLMFEGVLRAVGFSAPIWYRPDAELGWTLRPGASGWFTREGRAFVRVNPAGQRDRAHPLAKPEAVYRVAVLGDSYSEAMQVELESSWWWLLGERLQQCGFQPGKRIEVLNFGVSGYGTAQQYLALESTAIRYRPDLVLLQFTNGNDVQDNSAALAAEKERPFFVPDARGGLRIDGSFASSGALRKRSSPLYEALRQASDRSRVVQLVHAVRSMSLVGSAHAQADELEAGLARAPLAPPADPLWEQAWRVTEGTIAMIDDFARRHGARLAVVTVPYAIQVHPDRALRASVQAKLGVPDLFYPDRRIEALARARGFAAVALAPAMQRRGELLHGFDGRGLGHWNTRGHRVAADIIAASLCKPQH